MNEQLIHQLRALDRPTQPRPEFRDRLFDSLMPELAMRRRVVSRLDLRLAWAVVAAVAATLGGVVLLSAVDSEPAAPSSSPSASPSATPWAPGREPGWVSAATPPGQLDPGAAAFNVPLSAGLRDGEVWTLVPMFDAGHGRARVHSYDPLLDRWTDRGSIVDSTGALVASSNVDGILYPLAVGPTGDLILLGHTGPAGPRDPRQGPINVPYERVARRVDASTLTVTDWNPAPSRAAFRQSMGPMRAPDGRLVMQELVGRELVTPVKIVTYDPATNGWAEAAPTLSQRIRPAVAVDGEGGVYVIGGTSAQRSPSVERLDPVSGQWTRLSDVPADRNIGGTRWGHAAAFAGDGNLYVFAWSYQAEDTVIYRFDPAASTWTTLDYRLPFEPFDAIAASDGSIVVFGLEGPDLDQVATGVFTPGE